MAVKKYRGRTLRWCSKWPAESLRFSAFYHRMIGNTQQDPTTARRSISRKVVRSLQAAKKRRGRKKRKRSKPPELEILKIEDAATACVIGHEDFQGRVTLVARKTELRFGHGASAKSQLIRASEPEQLSYILEFDSLQLLLTVRPITEHFVTRAARVSVRCQYGETGDDGAEILCTKGDLESIAEQLNQYCDPGSVIELARTPISL